MRRNKTQDSSNAQVMSDPIPGPSREFHENGSNRTVGRRSSSGGSRKVELNTGKQRHRGPSKR